MFRARAKDCLNEGSNISQPQSVFRSFRKSRLSCGCSLRMSRARWKSISFVSLEQSFDPSGNPSLLWPVLRSLRQSSLIQAARVWILTTPFLPSSRPLLLWPLLRSLRQSFAPSGSLGWEVYFRCELWLVLCSLQTVLRSHFKKPSTSLRSLKQSFALSSSPSLLQEVQAAAEVYFNCDLSSSPSLLLPVLCSSGQSTSAFPHRRFIFVVVYPVLYSTNTLLHNAPLFLRRSLDGYCLVHSIV